MSCDSCGTCGTGGYTGPQPGDPDNNVALSASPAFGGIDVTWSYPATNPFAVAHTLLYRGTVASFDAARQIAVVAGNTYYDKLDDSLTYYYWIQIVSVNGTTGETIGPAWAMPQTLIGDMIEQLTGQIDAGVLSNALKQKIDQITLNKAQIDAAILDRIDGDEALSAALADVQAGLVQASTLLAQEVTSRTEGDNALISVTDTLAAMNASNLALIQQEQTTRVDATSALATQLETIAATTAANAAAILSEQTARADADSALANQIVTVLASTGGANGDVDAVAAAVTAETTARTNADSALASQITTAQSTLGGNIASVQTTLQTNIDTVNGKVTTIGARWTATVDVNGLVGGFGIYNDGSSVEAGFNVDTFWIGRTGANKRKPFIISNGVTYIDNAMINQLTADRIDSRGLTIKDAAGNVIFGSGNNLDWGRISGTSKPVDGATKNVVTTGTLANRPAGTDGDMYYASDATILYQKIAGAWVVAGTVGAPAGTLINGVGVATITTAVTNFNSSNDRNPTAVVAPVVATDGTAVDHSIRTNGSADISFEWTWGGTEGDIDGFQVVVYQSTSAAAYTFGTDVANETVYEIPAAKRALLLYGVSPDLYYSFAVRAYRSVDKDVAATGVILSTLVKATLAAENPYRPAASVAFAGDVTGTLNGVSAAAVTTAMTNFNASNDRNGAAITAPTVLADGTAVDHTLSSNGSADISFEWAWAGNEGDIDGFQVFVNQSSSSAAYTFGTTAAGETVYEVPASKRAFILFGVVPDKYYTFGVRAYRSVDKDIAASGVILSTLVKSTLAAENPYRPAAAVAFAGDVTGTVNGIAASNVNVWAQISGSGKPVDSATKNTVFRQSAAPTVGMTVNDIWFNTTTGATYSYSGATWVLVGDVTANNTAARIAGQGVLATQDMATVGLTINFPDGTTMLTSDFVNRLSKIGTNNISTFMDAAAIGNAYIGNLAVKNANIDNLTIGGEKIQNGAISGAYPAASSTAATTLSVTVVVPANTAALQVMSSAGKAFYATGNEGGSSYGPSAVTINVGSPGGGSQGSCSSSIGVAMGVILNPQAGTYTVTATRSGTGGTSSVSFQEGMSLVALVMKK